MFMGSRRGLLTRRIEGQIGLAGKTDAHDPAAN